MNVIEILIFGSNWHMGIYGVKISNAKKNRHLLLTETYLYKRKTITILYWYIIYIYKNMKCIEICVTNGNIDIFDPKFYVGQQVQD